MSVEKDKVTKTTEELNSYSTFERLVFNIKKIIERLQKVKVNWHHMPPPYFS